MGRWFGAVILCFAIAGFFPISLQAGNVDTYGIGSKATALGGAFSAYADDPFAIHYNPAGLTQISRPTLSLGANLIRPSLNIYNYRVTGVQVAPATEPQDFHDHSRMLAAPHLGYAFPVDASWTVGVALFVPYGLDLKWPGTPDAPGSFNTTHSWYLREVIAPAAAFTINERLSVGASLLLGKSQAGLEYRLFSPLLPALNNRLVKTDLEDDMNWSLNLGVLYKPNNVWAFGLTYRGATETEFEGTTRLEGMKDGDSLGIPGVTIQNTTVRTSTEIDHPEQVQAGVRYLPLPDFSLEVDLVWTRWSRIDGYSVLFDQKFLDAILLGPNNPGRTSDFCPRNWEDTRQVRIGAEWQVNKRIALRGAYFYDPSPIPDSSLDLQWADADKRTFSLGAGFDFGRITIDTVVQYTLTEGRRELNGESVALNNSYEGGGRVDPGSPPRVSLSADGHLWGGGITISCKF